MFPKCLWLAVKLGQLYDGLLGVKTRVTHPYLSFHSHNQNKTVRLVSWIAWVSLDNYLLIMNYGYDYWDLEDRSYVTVQPNSRISTNWIWTCDTRICQIMTASLVSVGIVSFDINHTICFNILIPFYRMELFLYHCHPSYSFLWLN